MGCKQSEYNVSDDYIDELGGAVPWNCTNCLTRIYIPWLPPLDEIWICGHCEPSWKEKTVKELVQQVEADVCCSDDESTTVSLSVSEGDEEFINDEETTSEDGESEESAEFTEEEGEMLQVDKDEKDILCRIGYARY